MECPRTEKLIGIEAAQHGNHHDGTDDRISKISEDAVRHRAQHKRISGDFLHRQNVQSHDIQQQINSHDGKHAAKNRPRNIAPRIAHFFPEINHAVPSINGVNDALQSQKYRNDKRPPRRNRHHRGVGDRRGFMRRPAEHEASNDQN